MTHAPERLPSPPWLPATLAIITAFEGCRLTAYVCPAGAWTIGWGTTRLIDRPVQHGDQITQQMADELLQNDVELRGRQLLALLPMAQQWPANRIAALISWAYNVGISAVEHSTLRARLLNREDPAAVIREELPRWNKVGDKKLEGLTRRRAAEVQLFLGQSSPAAVPRATSGGVRIPAGMAGPRKTPTLKPGDHHLIADDRTQTLTAYTHEGKRLWAIPCLCRGQGKETDWKTTNSDTPPGLYKIGRVYRDYEEDPSARFTAERRSFGWYSFDLEGHEGQEGPSARPYRDGIMIHGGGTACGWPGAWAPRQTLYSTNGCIRCHNVDLRERILPLLGLGTVWVSVLQEAP